MTERRLWEETPCDRCGVFHEGDRIVDAGCFGSGGVRREIIVDYELMVCVTHWRIYEARRREPYASFGFHACPVEEGLEHHVVPFVGVPGE